MNSENIEWKTLPEFDWPAIRRGLARRRRACVLALKSHAWSITARLYMAGCARMKGVTNGCELDALVGQLDDLWRRMDAPELQRVEAELARRKGRVDANS